MSLAALVIAAAISIPVGWRAAHIHPAATLHTE
jgi:hypothetical protein